MLASLQEARAYPHPTTGISLVETHISWVFLTGPYAYKIKKPVSLGFLDFSSLEQRLYFCREELRLNQRLAPDLYLDLVEVQGPPERAQLGGEEPGIEVAVRMRRFDEQQLLSALALDGRVAPGQMETFAAELAAFHHAAAVAPPLGPYGTPQAVLAPARANLEVLRRLHPQPQLLHTLWEWTLGEAERLKDVFAQRLAEGRVREGHGDLHLGNLALYQGKLVGFDCLEFNPSLRWIDVLSDGAFLAMDLLKHGQGVLAGRMLNRWLMTCGDYGGLVTWPWYLTYRALVRAKVLALRLEQLPAAHTHTPQADTMRGMLADYLGLACSSHGSSLTGALLLTHGVTGSGKSHMATALCQKHGWIHLRSDVERRRCFGSWGTALHPPRQGDPYSPSMTAELYGSILPQAAEAVLRGGLSVVVDATFLKRSQREPLIHLAQRLQVPLVILECPVSFPIARERIARRLQEGGDPSEADISVLEQQWQSVEPLSAAEAPFRILAANLPDVESAIQCHPTLRQCLG